MSKYLPAFHTSSIKMNASIEPNERLRIEFEANIEKHYPTYMSDDWFSFDRRSDGIYEKIAVQCMWIGWQAARALSAA